MIDSYYGVISEETKDTDYQLLAGVVDLPQPRNDYWTKQIQYDQKEVHSNSCTIHGCIGAVSSLSGHTFSIDDRKYIWNLALAQGADPKVGWYINKAVDLVRKYATDNLKEEFSTYRVSLDSQEFIDNLKKGYCGVVGYRGNAQYNKDKGDGVLEGTSLIGNSTYGHCLRMVISQDPNYAEVVIDNYPSSGYNTYKIPVGNLSKLVENNIFFKDAYFFAYKAETEAKPTLVSPFAIASVEKAKKKGITVWDNPSEPLTPELCNAILFKLGIVTSDAPMTKERFIVSLDRLGMLD